MNKEALFIGGSPCSGKSTVAEQITKKYAAHYFKIDDFIVTEGAAYTPRVMKKYGIKNYITIVPTPEFQILHYKEREWIPYVLEGCSNKEKAFDNWMKRDILFAKQVLAECKETKVPCIVNDGTRAEEEIFDTVKEQFKVLLGKYE